jgi:hypothetical protein
MNWHIYEKTIIMNQRESEYAANRTAHPRILIAEDWFHSLACYIYEIATIEGNTKIWSAAMTTIWESAHKVSDCHLHQWIAVTSCHNHSLTSSAPNSGCR